jgi:S1-C subfamily serine protease
MYFRGQRLWAPGQIALATLSLFVAACQGGSNSDQPAAPTVAPPAATTVASAAPAASSPIAVTSSPVVAERSAVSGVPELASAVRNVAQRVKPAIVQITVEQQVQAQQFDQPFTVPAGVGSGVIYDQQGHILTNNHVVEGAQTLLVGLPDGRSFPGTLVGADPQTDLAVLQISGDNLPVAELGDSRQLQVGDWVVAIGNALSLPGGPTVTQGVVSALGRTIQEPSSPNGRGQGSPQRQPGPFLFDVIQTDAPINPGNSGGALVDLQSRVVGINTLVAGQAESGVPAQGIGFAIAISTAKPIADALVTNGRVAHPYIGITYAPLNPLTRAQLSISAKAGAVVGQIIPGSPAAQAGLQPRDVIIEVDGQPLQGESGLAEAINSHKVGDTIVLTVIRAGQNQRLSVQLAEMPAR